MREDFLYHLWKFQKFNAEAVKTSEGDTLQIIHPGIQNDLSGPDFFNARIHIGDQLWAGNVEIHIKASDWYSHHHETDRNYDNVILHVVWEDDAEIFRKDSSVIPTLVLKDKVEEEILRSYSELLEKNHLRINCEHDFPAFPDFQMQHWLERLYFERLEQKSIQVQQILLKTGNDWEATLFILLCRSFGLKVNSEAFIAMAQSFDFKIVRKLAGDQFSLEALFMGQSKIINGNDQYAIRLQEKFDYLKHKFSLENDYLPAPQFFRLRPDNFPGIRLAQLAALYAEKRNLFRQLMAVEKIQDFYSLFDVQVSDYWKSHYNFEKSHRERNKKLTSGFIDLLIINCILPLKSCYSKFTGSEYAEQIQDLISEIALEKNSTVRIFNELRPGTAYNAMHSQALLQLKNEYCNLNKCLQCELGASLLKKSPKYI